MFPGDAGRSLDLIVGAPLAYFMYPQAPGGRVRSLGWPRISSGARSRLPGAVESNSSAPGTTRSLVATLDLYLPRRGRNFWATLARWHERASQRRALAKLDADLLRDIGITHRRAKREAEKPFWKR